MWKIRLSQQPNSATVYALQRFLSQTLAISSLCKRLRSKYSFSFSSEVQMKAMQCTLQAQLHYPSQSVLAKHYCPLSKTVSVQIPPGRHNWIVWSVNCIGIVWIATCQNILFKWGLIGLTVCKEETYASQMCGQRSLWQVIGLSGFQKKLRQYSVERSEGRWCQVSKL